MKVPKERLEDCCVHVEACRDERQRISATMNQAREVNYRNSLERELGRLLLAGVDEREVVVVKLFSLSEARSILSWRSSGGNGAKSAYVVTNVRAIRAPRLERADGAGGRSRRGRRGVRLQCTSPASAMYS